MMILKMKDLQRLISQIDINIELMADKMWIERHVIFTNFLFGNIILR